MTKPIISTIIPVYNVEKYLKESIESVIKQSIGFNNIEIILIDDGSTDGSSDIGMSYSEKYSNIIYKKYKNSGVSRARNKGIDIATGDYIHFLDADDLISKNFYKQSVKFLEKNESIGFVASKIMMFDAIIDSHPLNFKFKKDRVIDIFEEPNNPILHVISGLFRSSDLVGYRFDESISIAEDMKFMSSFLFDKRKYGLINDTVYHYRKRSDGTSAIATSRDNKRAYTDVVEGVYGYILEKWKIIESEDNYFDYLALYDLSHRLDQDKQDALNRREEKQYIDSIYNIIRNISDRAIVENHYIGVQQKIFILSLKYGDSFQRLVSIKEKNIYFNSYKLWNIDNNFVFIDFIKEASGTYKIEGYINGLVDATGLDYYISNGETCKKLNFVERKQREKSFLGEVYDRGGAFDIYLDLKPSSEISFFIEHKGNHTTLDIKTGRYTGFGALDWTYRVKNNKIFKRTKNKIFIYEYSIYKNIVLECRMLLQILLNWRVGTFIDRFSKFRSRNLANLSLKGKFIEFAKPFAFSLEAVFYIPRDIILRLTYYILKARKRKPVWLVSDRSMAAGDNGEAIFKYIMSLEDRPADVYFVMSRKSKDLERIKSIGPVLYQESLIFKLKFLLSDKIIASQADIETTNPFIRLLDRYVDLFNFDFIFLQHGIIRHNLSSWLNRFEKDISLFITSAKKEYDSIFSNPYYYDKKNVLLSGLPRYDYLKNQSKNKIILAPTYRKNLVRMKTDRVGRRGYDTEFKKSEYRNFYNNLMNDSRIINLLRSNNIKGEFYLHPVFSEQKVDFDSNEYFSVMEFPYDYKTAFKEGSLLISDHSSVVFDFAYLKKPVVYAHFDVDTFFQGHSYDESNFFSDEDDGFGGVYYDYETLVNGIIDIIKNNFTMDDKYKRRVDDFFYKVDAGNSKRVYEAIIDMDKKGKQ